MIQEEFDAMLCETPYTELKVYSAYVEGLLYVCRGYSNNQATFTNL